MDTPSPASLPLPPIQDELLPACQLDDAPLAHSNDPLRTLMKSLNMTSIPPHPTKGIFQRGGCIKVDLRLLHLDPAQLDAISKIYNFNKDYHAIFTGTVESQQSAQEELQSQGINIRDMGDLGNKWSRRWSKQWQAAERNNVERVLVQCQCGSSSTARKSKEDAKKIANNRPIYSKEWIRKMPYDFTGCLAHIDLTYDMLTFSILRITGFLEHNTQCNEQTMRRLPAIPIHPHVWEIALRQLDDGASFTAVQAKNRELFLRKQYRGQEACNPAATNIRYVLFPSDSSRLYRMHNRLKGVDFSQRPEYNLDDWVNPLSANYVKELHDAIFHYNPRTDKSKRLSICIQTEEMKNATWQYAHNGQLVLDGTFGVSEARLLLFIALSIDNTGRGIPLAFFLFSAPTGNQATHAGYDAAILTELLKAWVTSLGEVNGKTLCPTLVITDTDMKERAALHIVWPSTLLLLCQYHVRNCWTNKRKSLIKMGHEKFNFHKEQVKNRLCALEKSLITTSDYVTACELITTESTVLTKLSLDSTASGAARAGLAHLTYLTTHWMPEPLWQGWSLAGRKIASVRLKIPIERVVTTTNHLEAFNGVLKHKFIHNLQKGGRRLRFDLLIFVMIKHILPGIFLQRKIQNEYYNWLFARFPVVGNRQAKSTKATVDKHFKTNPTCSEFAWWPADSITNCAGEVRYIIKQGRIGPFEWSDTYTLRTTCASSLEDIGDPNHRRYVLYLNCYGWSMCSCNYFQKTGIACKHLWAFREVMPQLNPPYSFIFPTSHAVAAQIYTTLLPHLPVKPSSNLAPSNSSTSAAVTLSETVPNLMLPDVQQEDQPSMADVLDLLTEPLVDTDNDSYVDNEHGIENGSVDDNDNECTESTNAEAIQLQIKSKVEHELRIILPRLHGIQSLLQESSATTRLSINGLQELYSISYAIEQFKLGQTEENETQDTAVPISRKRRRSNDDGYSQGAIRPVLLPPSPERSQKRKPSRAFF